MMAQAPLGGAAKGQYKHPVLVAQTPMGNTYDHLLECHLGTELHAGSV